MLGLGSMDIDCFLKKEKGRKGNSEEGEDVDVDVEVLVDDVSVYADIDDEDEEFLFLKEYDEGSEPSFSILGRGGGNEEPPAEIWVIELALWR